MSAIAGLFRTDGQPVARNDVQRMISALPHRAPNAAATWAHESVALAHGALWSTPEAARESQPQTVGSCVITADVRLDNREDLVAALGTDRAIGDAALILRAYERWGEACVPKLLGDFAFAIWDGANRRLFCARDHIGAKPFYYHHAPAALLFASEIKALLTSPLVPYSLNPGRVADYLVDLFDDRAATFYRDIYRLPAGHTMTVGRDGTRILPYWSLDHVQEIRLGSDEAYEEALRECLAAAVKSRLRSRRPVGSLLNGGLDTASIVATARSFRGPEDGVLDVFTAVFPGIPVPDLGKIDERAFVDALVAQGGLRAHYVRGDLLSPLGDVDRALWHLDEAFAAPHLYLHWGLYEAARHQGVGVLLDGTDGDAFSRRHGAGVSSLLWRTAQPLVPLSWRRAVRRLWRREPAWRAQSIIRPEFAQRTGVAERMEAFEQGHAGSSRAAHRRAMESGRIPYLLETTDKAAAAFGIEPRYPFLDRRLMELSLALPVDQKRRGGWSRSVMRRAMKGLVPDEVRWRADKANRTPNFTQRLLAADRRLVSEVLDQPEVIADYVDIAALRRAHDRYVRRPGSDAASLTVHSAVVLALWLQRAKLTG